MLASGLVTASVMPVDSAPPAAAAAEPGTPGVPSAPETLFVETFENRATDTNTLVTDYVGEMGATYTGDGYWTARESCNGFVIDSGSPRDAADCTDAPDAEPSFDRLSAIPYALGQLAGADPEANAAVTSATAGDGAPGLVQVETVAPLPLATANRFVTFSVDAGAQGCDTGSSPLLRFYATDAAGTETPVSGAPIDVCNDPRGQTVEVPAPSGAIQTVRGGTFTADSSYLATGDGVGVRIRNENGSGVGNDGAYDNVAVLDATPQLDMSFSPATVDTGATSTLTLTVTNTSELAAKDGWAFTDALPDGLVIADAANVANACTANVDAPAGGSTVTVADGVLAAGEESCTIAVDVTAAAAGTYTNGPDDIGGIAGMNLPLDATVTFEAAPAAAQDPPGDVAAPPGTVQDPSGTAPNTPGSATDAPIVLQQALACQQVHALQGDSPHTIYQVDTTSGDMTGVAEFGPGSGTSNGLGISADGTLQFAHRDGLVLVHDSVAETTQSFPGVPGLNATHGGVDFSTGIYYFGNIPTGAGGVGLDGEVYAFDPATNTTLGLVATLDWDVTAPGGNGDWGFDSFGNMFVTSGATSGIDNNGLYVARGPLPSTPQDDPVTVTASRATTITTADPINGVAVDVGGFLYLASSTQLFQVQPSSGEVVNTESLDPSGESVDLASCATPATLVLAKDVVGRFAPDDQFEVTITGGGIDENNTGTTAGTDTGLQNGPDEIAGPFLGLPGETYDIAEAGVGDTDLANYDITWQCTNLVDGSVIASGTGPSGSFTMPTSATGIGPSIACQFVNTPGGLEIAKTATPSDEVLPGDTVTYTVTVENTGAVAFDPATFTDDLTGVLDDATFNDDATASTGTVTFTEPTLSWSGTLAPGDTATITYSVTVNDPPTGDGTLTNAVVGPAGSNCLDGTEPGCTIDIPVRDLEILKTATPSDEVLPGETVTYTVTVTNTGQVPYTALTPATFTDDLTAVLDDATFNDDAAADIGTATFTSPTLSWTGPLAPGETATITYSVTVNDPLTGDGVLTNAVVGPPESNCDLGTEPGCTIDVPVRALQIVKTSDPGDPAVVEPGGTVSYTVTVTNTGQVPYTALNPATFTDDLTPVLDDATFNDDAAADIGTATFADPTLSWTGALAPGGTATITYSVTVNDPPSGDGTLTNAVVGPDESNCPEGSDDPDCSTDVLVRALEIVKTSEPAEAQPGDTVSYTVTVTNIGQVPYTSATPASFIDDLTEVLDDATFNDDAAASTGTVNFSSPLLSWTGALAPGATATITYSVTVNDPLTGDGVMTNAVVGPDESNCEDSAAPDCTIPIPIRALEIVKTSEPAEVEPGGTVSYSVTVTNTGQVPYTDLTPATFTDDLTPVLDDATFNDDAAADTGTVAFTDPTLTWSGALAPGETATITYSVTVNDPPSGDGTLTNAVVGPDESNCPEGSTDPDCTTPTPVRALAIEKTATPSDEVLPGDTVTYTVTVTNTGQVAYTDADPATFDDDLTAVLDDATFNDDAAADIGTATFASPVLSWSGALEPGETATITYSVTVNDPLTGDGVLTNAVVGPDESNCDVGTEPGCTIDVPVRALEIVKTSDPAEVLPGGTVSYTVTVTNTGQVPYTSLTPATFDDDLTDVLDDATFNDDAAATTGTVAFADPTLTWSGALAPGATATITYSVTVNDPLTGDGVLTNGVVGPDESNCDEPTDPGCFTPTPVRALEIVKTSDADFRVVPGQTITYTVTVTNTGQVAYTALDPATFDDDLSAVLDDTSFVAGSETADIGTVTFTDPTLSWSGPLAPGETATVSYAVTVNDPPTGDGVIDNVVTGPPESNCAADDRSLLDCVTLSVDREMAVTKEASVTEAFAGDVVTYTVTVTNISEVPFTALFPASFSDDLSGVLDDATFNEDATADIGTVAFTDPTLSWSGALAPGETATITYSVTVNDPLTGDGELDNTIITPPTGNCPEGSDDPDCGTVTPVIPEDWGDAPDSYATLDASDGPSHGLRLEPAADGAGAAAVAPAGTLGRAVTPLAAGAPSDVAVVTQAAGDPLLAIGSGITPEDDGVPDPAAATDEDDAFEANPQVQLPVGDTLTLSVPVVNETGGDATLAGWIDANGNGTFDPTELAVVTAGETGTVDLTLTVPADAAFLDSTFLRLRLFGGTVDEPVPTGFADSGEVEDWAVQILPAPEPPEPPAPEPEPPAPSPAGPAGFLPRTGAGIARLVALGLALLLAGVTATRRARRPSTPVE